MVQNNSFTLMITNKVNHQKLKKIYLEKWCQGWMDGNSKMYQNSSHVLLLCNNKDYNIFFCWHFCNYLNISWLMRRGGGKISIWVIFHRSKLLCQEQAPLSRHFMVVSVKKTGPVTELHHFYFGERCYYINLPSRNKYLAGWLVVTTTFKSSSD